MEEERTGKEISRRRLIKRLGVGTAAAWLAPIVTSLGSRAEAGGCIQCSTPGPENGNCAWVCGGTLYQCGSGCGPFGAAYCSHDVDGNCFCWEDSYCNQSSDCAVNSDCPPGYACIPDTCCGTPKCLPGCGMGPRRRRRHGKTATGKVF
jgi:hypothetical protein